VLELVAEMAETISLFDADASTRAGKLAWPLTYLSDDHTQSLTLLKKEVAELIPETCIRKIGSGE
jgi:hypothetical protein